MFQRKRFVDLGSLNQVFDRLRKKICIDNIDKYICFSATVFFSLRAVINIVNNFNKDRLMPYLLQFTLFQTKNLQSPGSYISKRTWNPSQKAITK